MFWVNFAVTGNISLPNCAMHNVHVGEERGHYWAILGNKYHAVVVGVGGQQGALHCVHPVLGVARARTSPVGG